MQKDFQTMGNYTFQLIRCKEITDDKGSWYFKAQTPEEIFLHLENIVKPYFQEGADAYANKFIESLNNNCYSDKDNLYVPHADNEVESLLRTQIDIKQNNYVNNPSPFLVFYEANALLKKMMNTRLEHLTKHGAVYLSNGLTQLGFNEQHFQVLDTVEKQRFEYPAKRLATKEDIKVIKWPGGKHWYAKIKNIDVVDEKGNQKWDSYNDAVVAAHNYLYHRKIYI